MTDLSRPAADHDLAALQARALRRRQRHMRSACLSRTFTTTIIAHAHRLLAHSRALPARYALHLLVGLLVPLAVIASQSTLGSWSTPAATTSMPVSATEDFVVPLAPLTLDRETHGDLPVPDSDFAAIDALPIPALRPGLLAPPTVMAAVVAESANVRAGPGTNYDKVGDLPDGTPLQVLARFAGWYQARTSDDRLVWVAAELLDLDATAADLLPQAKNIPAPPPARIGVVAEESLNLRDGPGTSYVGMTKLSASTQLDLLARYQDWFQVQTPEGHVGWVLGQYLTIDPGVVERVERVASVPDPNPALIGQISESNVNLRGGPGVAYDKLRMLGANAQLDLLGRYQDWFKVRTPRGTVGWVSNELVEVSTFVARRVPIARDIPTLAQARPTSRRQTAGRSIPAPSAQAGNIIEFAAQFVGARYVWGGGEPGGFDCSGFTRYVYGQFGQDLPHSSAGQYSTQYGTMISDPADLRPGDLVFFVNTYKRGISHVGIYVGDGDVVQALSPRLGVGVANLNGGYWAQHYYGAIRPSR